VSYHEHGDSRHARDIRAGAPAAFEAWMAFNRAALHNDDGELSRAQVEMIALGVALTTQCPYCIEDHSAAARKAGVTEAQLAETIMIASAMRAGAGFAHGFLAEKYYAGAGAAE